MATTRLDSPPPYPSMLECTEVIRTFVVIDANGRSLEAEEYALVLHQRDVGGTTTIRSPRAFRLKVGHVPLQPCAEGIGFLLETPDQGLSLLVESTSAPPS